MFDANLAKDKIIDWIREWFEVNGPDCVAIVGISGGKDSTIVAKLCVEALGKDRVWGVLMPNVWNEDYNISLKVCRYLGIDYDTLDISTAYESIIEEISNSGATVSDQTQINLPARLRMATLYAFSQSMDGRVANTCNLSEDYVGYATKYGDGAGDFSPISQYTVTEVRQIGKALGIPDEFVYKVPTDGLCGQTDEDKLGFTYDILDKYIRTGICENYAIMAKIDDLHEKNRFKLLPMEHCPYYYYGVKEMNGND